MLSIDNKKGLICNFLHIAPKINAKWGGTVSLLGKFNIVKYQKDRFHLFTSEASGEI